MTIRFVPFWDLSTNKNKKHQFAKNGKCQLSDLDLPYKTQENKASFYDFLMRHMCQPKVF